MISAARREDIVSALRRGTVPSSGLDSLAVGIEGFAPTLSEELESVAAGRGFGFYAAPDHTREAPGRVAIGLALRDRSAQ